MAAQLHASIRAMTQLSDFPITRKWPAQHPQRIQLYSLPTPNGVKASIMLEETGLPYEVHRVAFDTISQALDQLYHQLDALDLSAGSAAARRLFS